MNRTAFKVGCLIAALMVCRTGSAVFPLPLESAFVPSGWMGDGKEKDHPLVTLKRVSHKVEGKPVVAVRITYTGGKEGWAGIYWQYPENNWGQDSKIHGRDLTGARAFSFLARGAQGGEILEFKVGGIRGDTVDKSTGKVSLDKTWRLFTINLSRSDMSNVAGGFSWNAAASDNNEELEFYLVNMVFE